MSSIFATLLSFFSSENGGVWRVVSLVLAAAVVLGWTVFGVYRWRSDAEIKSLKNENTVLRQEVGTISAANSAQSAAINSLQEQRDAADAAIVSAQVEIAAKTSDLRRIEAKLKKEMQAHAVFKTILTRSVANALCLQWLAADGRLPGDYVGADPAVAFDGRADPVAEFCRSWDIPTTEDVIDYNGALIRSLSNINARIRAAK